ncbi:MULTISPECIES: CynX/NimT family MFS transporter [Lysinibacillus]|uniref:MFS transporter n=1 Tax=Lysinibacillus TaxID=400634 RepID=UPI00257FD4D4|nr:MULTISPECIES: MFS transporter [Lysinibacillus]
MINKQWKASSVLMVVSIFFIALNMRPAVTAIGPLYNVLLESLHISNTKMSFLTSIPVFCMGIFAPIAVPLQKKLGTKTAITLLILLLALANGLRFLKESYGLLVVTSFLAGFAIAIIGPMLNAYIKKKFPNRFTTVVGIYSFGIGTGATLSAALTVTLYRHFDGSWTIALGSWSILALSALIMWFLLVQKEERELSRKDEKSEHVIRNPWKSCRAWTILIYFGLQTSLFFSVMSWLVPILQDKGYSLGEASSILTLMSFIQMIGNIVVPILMEKWTSRIAWLFALGVLGILGFALLWVGSGTLLLMAVFIIGIVLSGLFPIGLLLPLDEAETNEEANSWSSMVLSGGFIISAIIPVVIGYCYDITGNHTVTFAIFMIIMLAIMATTYRLKKSSL